VAKKRAAEVINVDMTKLTPIDTPTSVPRSTRTKVSRYHATTSIFA
jgi:hypothetical protein